MEFGWTEITLSIGATALSCWVVGVVWFRRWKARYTITQDWVQLVTTLQVKYHEREGKRPRYLVMGSHAYREFTEQCRYRNIHTGREEYPVYDGMIVVLRSGNSGFIDLSG